MAARIKHIILVFPLVFMIAFSAFAETETYVPPTENSSSMGDADIRTQLKSLQDEVSRLREEADVRNKLEATVDEKTDQEKEILTAAGQDYSLAREGNLEVTYGFIYAYNATDILESLDPSVVDHSSNHNITNNVGIKYALFDNLSLSTNIPFVYKSDQRSTSNERNATDIGDISFGGIWQPKKSDGRSLTMMYNSSIVFPSGASPFKIDPDTALSTGSGFYSVSAGFSASKSLDPVFVFGSGSIYYPLNASDLSQRRPNNRILTKVAPGKTLGLSLGMAYALSYTVSINTSISFSYATKYKYYWENESSSTSGESTSAVLNIGSGWRISPQKTISTSLGIGLTNSASDFTFSFSIPFDFKL